MKLVITGGTSGIGKAIVELLKNRYEIFVLSRTFVGKLEGIKYTAYDISSCNGTFLDKFYEETGPIDVLINNAGIFPLKEFLESSWEEDLRNIYTNFLGHYFLTKFYIGKTMEQNISLQIINIASISGIGTCENVMYGCAKSALIHMTKCLANYYPSLIKVNCISPGFVKTNLVPGETPKDLIETIPLKKEARPEDVARVVEFVLSQDYFQGSNIIIDGGLICR